MSERNEPASISKRVFCYRFFLVRHSIKTPSLNLVIFEKSNLPFAKYGFFGLGGVLGCEVWGWVVFFFLLSLISRLSRRTERLRVPSRLSGGCWLPSISKGDPGDLLDSVPRRDDD